MEERRQQPRNHESCTKEEHAENNGFEQGHEGGKVVAEMSYARAYYKLKNLGFTVDDFHEINRLISSHPKSKGGQHTNGGCGRGRCDYGDPACAAWTRLLEILADSLPEPEEPDLPR